MAVKIEVPYKRTFTVPLDPKSTFDYFANVEKSVPECFPGLEELQPTGPDRYRWVFEKIGYSSYELQIKLATEFRKEAPSRLTATPLPGDESSRFTGSWQFTPEGSGTSVTFDAKFEIELPIPGFLKGMAGPVAQKEMTKLFDRYTDRAQKNLAK